MIIWRFIFIVFGISGCVMLGTKTIHSQSSKNSTPLIHRHVHGGTSRNSPPEGILVFSDVDTTVCRISARVIKSKTNWGGVILPFMPLFIIPAADGYKNNPNTLELKISILSSNKMLLYMDSLEIINGGNKFGPVDWVYDGRKHKVDGGILNVFSTLTDSQEVFIFSDFHFKKDELKIFYKLDAHNVEKFTLILNGFYCDEGKIIFDKIEFNKVKQKWSFVGP